MQTSPMNMLPDLCIHRILESLCETGSRRRPCDVVRDCITLAATSHGTRRSFAVPLADIMDPQNDYERLHGDILASQLKNLCRKNSLIVGGNKTVLRERLRVELHDTRLPMCGLGHRFCERANKELVRSDRTRAMKTLASECAERRRILSDRLRTRGCSLRGDSEMSRAYINQTGNCRSLEATVDVAEEMQFFYMRTDYHRILTDMRDLIRDTSCSFWRRVDRNRHLDQESEADGDEEEEEARRQIAKSNALQLWITKHASPDNTHLEQLPRSMRVKDNAITQSSD